jgi:anti-sigma regulatory factor (Ser/Thr protein kinase)
VSGARAKAVGLLRDWNALVDADVVELLLSEVMTNAVLHGFGDSPEHDALIRIDLTLTSRRFRVAVHDPDLGEGMGVSVRHPDLESENGHGLELVEALSVSWGCEATAVGKYVYFELASYANEPDVYRSARDVVSEPSAGGR